MSIQTNCPDCGKPATVPDELLGKRVRCPSCKQPFTVKAPEPLAEEITDREAAALQAPASKKGPFAPPPKFDEESERPPPRDELVPPPPGGRFRKQKAVPSVMSRELMAGIVFLAVSSCCGLGGIGIFTVVSFFMRSSLNDMSGKIDTPQNDEQLTKVLEATNNGDGFRRADAFNALTRANVIEHRRGEVTARALACVDDGHGFARDAARGVVKKWAGKESVKGLIDKLDHHDGGVRHLALEVLGKLRDPAAVAPVARRLGPDREHASKALREMGPMAEREVCLYLTDPDAGVRREACAILKRIGGAESIVQLQQVQGTDGDRGVKSAAKDALATIRERTKG